MSAAIFDFETIGGRVTEKSRPVVAEQFRELEDGWHQCQIKEGRISYTPSRYKYYFSEVMTQILLKAAKRYLICVPSTGEAWHPRNTKEVHKVMKDIYLPVTTSVIVEDSGPMRGATTTSAGSSTNLSDSEFINGFMEQILADHSGPPFLIDFEDYHIWKKRMKAKRDARKQNEQ